MDCCRIVSIASMHCGHVRRTTISFEGRQFVSTSPRRSAIEFSTEPTRDESVRNSRCVAIANPIPSAPNSDSSLSCCRLRTRAETEEIVVPCKAPQIETRPRWGQGCRSRRRSLQWFAHGQRDLGECPEPRRLAIRGGRLCLLKSAAKLRTPLGKWS